MPSVDPRLPLRLRSESAIRAGENAVYRAVRAGFAILHDRINRALAGSRMDASVLNAQWPEWLAAVDDLILPAIGRVYSRSFDDALPPPPVTAAAIPDMSGDEYVDAHLASVRNRMVGVAEAVFDLIRTELIAGRAEGEDWRQLAARVDGVLAASGSVNWKGRAVTVARTETITAYNTARLQGAAMFAEHFGFDTGEMSKEWLATRDTRTRPSHAHADGQVVPFTHEFRLESSTDGINYAAAPGDLSLPPGETINCRCSLLVHYGSLEASAGTVATATVTFDYHPDQLRVPKGHGEISGRWLDTPGGILSELGDAAKGLVEDPDNLPGLSADLRARGLDDAADRLDAFAAIDWSKRKVDPGEMTLYDVPKNVSFDGTTRTKPGMHPLTKQDYVDHFNRNGQRVPPGWANVLAADADYDPGTHANRQVINADKPGQSQYAAGWNDYKAGIKYVRAAELSTREAEIRAEIEKDVLNDPAAAALALQMVLAIRTGQTNAPATKKGHIAIGASTMPASAVSVDGDTVSFTYTGKSGVPAALTTNDPLIKSIAEHYLAHATSPDAKLFPTNEDKVRDYFQGVQQRIGVPKGTKFTPKDYRTLHGTAIAQRMVESIGRPAKDDDEYQEFRKQIANAASDFLNNKPDVALGSYINPKVFDAIKPVLAAAANPTDDGGDPATITYRPFDAATLADIWTKVARPDVDLTGFGDIDPFDTYEDLSEGDEMDYEDPTLFLDPAYAPGVDRTITADGAPMADDDTIPADVLAQMGDLTAEPVPWHAVLAPEGVLSGDMRKFAPDSLRWRDLPLPLSWQKATAMGHDGSVVVGRIDDIHRSADGLMQAHGVFHSSPESDEAIHQLATQMIRGVSVDVDDADFAYEDEAGNPVDGNAMPFDTEDEPVSVVTDGRICGATLCAIPAFQEAFVSLGEPPTEWGVGGYEVDDVAALRAIEAALLTYRWHWNPLQKRDPFGKWADEFSRALTAGQVAEFKGGSAIAHLKYDADGIATFDRPRQRLHRTIRAKVLRGVKPVKDRKPVFNVLGGGPAAGKSTFTAAHPELEKGVALINPDEAKELLPEYNARIAAGDATSAAGFVHEESSYVSKAITKKALQKNYDITLDGTGDSSAGSMIGKIDQARANGYEVHGYYVTVPTDVALDRAMARAEATGRYVNPDVIADTHRKVSRVLPSIVDHFDTLELVDTSTTPPTRVYSKDRDGKITVWDKDLWAAFKAKGAE